MGRSGGGGGGGGGSFSGGGRGGGSFSGGGGHSGGRSGGHSGGFGGGSFGGGPRGGGHPHGGPRGGGFDGPHGGPHGPRGPRGPRFGFGPSVYVGPSVNVGGGGCRGCFGSVIGIFLVMVLLTAMYGAMGSCSGRGDYGGNTYSSSYTATSDTVRTKLDSGAVSKTAYYTDEDGDWVHSASRIESGLSYFYDKTGVQPYVYILKNGSVTSSSELETLAEKYYDQLFSDEGHFLLVFCDTGDGSFNAAYWYGTAARTVMDDEAISVLQQALSLAYDNADTDEEVFSDAFRNTADTIMKAAEKEEQSATTGKVALAVGGVIVVGGIAYVVVRNKKKADAERKERADQILNTPLEKFGDAENPTSDRNVEDLASKYEDKSDDA